MRLGALLLAIHAGTSLAGLVNRGSETASVVLPSATIIGTVKDHVESFNGIRMQSRQLGQIGLGHRNGLASRSSILGTLANIPFVNNATGQSEDCLTITVTRPAGTTADAKLPVLFWIYGGGFELGWSSMYDGTSLVNYGIDTKKPFIFVAVNYRVNGFGFLAGKEILKDGASNLGLLDQRMGLEWVADNIARFGGDPDKVTISGESAGSISVVDQMVLYGGDHTYKGKALFRGGIMDSGSITPAEPVDSDRAQAVYDGVVEEGGCQNSSDTLECLRSLDYETFLSAVTSRPGLLSWSGVALSYLPRPDGKVLPDSPDVLVQDKRYAPIPFIIGDQEDEGTLFSLFQSNVTNSKQLVDYLKNVMFPNANEEDLTSLVETYGSGTSAITKGSPFGTGLQNEIFPGFKQRSAVIGDILFTLSRRTFLEMTNKLRPDVPSWSFLASYDHGTPVLGTFHTSDILQFFFGIYDNYTAKSIRTYYLNFVYSQNPNTDLVNGTYPEWPRWGKAHQLLNFGVDKATTIKDNFRADSHQAIKKIGNVLRL